LFWSALHRFQLTIVLLGIASQQADSSSCCDLGIIPLLVSSIIKRSQEITTFGAFTFVPEKTILTGSLDHFRDTGK